MRWGVVSISKEGLNVLEKVDDNFLIRQREGIQKK